MLKRSTYVSADKHFINYTNDMNNFMGINFTVKMGQQFRDELPDYYFLPKRLPSLCAVLGRQVYL